MGITPPGKTGIMAWLDCLLLLTHTGSSLSLYVVILQHEAIFCEVLSELGLPGVKM